MNHSSKPTASIIAAGIVAILGGLFFLLTSSLGLLGTLLGSQPNNIELPPFMRSTLLGVMVFLICLSIFGVATGIGLLLLRNWARISVLVWAGFSVFFAAVGIVVIFFAAVLQQQENLPVQAMWIFRLLLGVIYGVPLLVGIWWLILFNRKAIKLQFAGSVLPQKPGCPTPIAILAWIFIASALNVLLLPFFPLRIPMLLFGHLVSGEAARIFLILICALMAVAGVGLIKLKRWSYTLALTTQFFGLANGIVSLLSPNFKTFSDSVISEMEKSAPISNSGFSLAHFPHYSSWAMGFGLVLACAILGVLLYYRTRFLELAAAANG